MKITAGNIGRVLGWILVIGWMLIPFYNLGMNVNQNKAVRFTVQLIRKNATAIAPIQKWFKGSKHAKKSR